MTEIGNIYAKALYGLAAEQGLSQQVLQQLTALQTSFAGEPAFIKLLCAPGISKQERCGILDSSFAGMLQPCVLNFLKILTEKGYMRHFDDCCRAYEALYNEENGILTVKAVTAVALTPQQTQRLADTLSRHTGKTVVISNTVDAGCMGGVILDYDGKRVDDSLRHRLDAVNRLLKNTTL